MINYSELLWSSGRNRERGNTSSSPSVAQEFELVPTLQNVPVEEAQITNGTRIGLLMDSRSSVSDRFRFLRMRLRELQQRATLRSLVITSPLPGDGKSTIALGLATALAATGKQTALLVEADLHHPRLAASLGVSSRPGLSECLEEGLNPLSQIRRIKPLGWYLLQAGTPTGNPTELLQSDAFSRLVQEAGQYFDWILIDTPPVLPLTDALSTSRCSDATLLVARANRTSRRALEEAIQVIGASHIAGIILNGAEELAQLYSNYCEHYRKQ